MAKTEKRRRAARLPKQIELAVRAAEDKKAVDLAVLDLRKAAGFTDYFVLASGNNARQVRAIADAVIDALSAAGAKPAHVEGYDRSEWILLDYFDFIVHIFAPEPRVFYALERLWAVERFDRNVVPAPIRRGLGFTPPDLLWILTHAPSETVILRPDPTLAEGVRLARTLDEVA